LIIAISVLLTGFSIFSALVLLCAYLFYLPDMRKTSLGKFALVALVLNLQVLQVGHYLFFTEGFPALLAWWYLAGLIFTPASFYFFSRAVIFPKHKASFIDILHVIPILVSLIFPLGWIPLLAFSIGASYTLWFVLVISKMRQQHARYRAELFFFGIFLLMAFVALGLGFLLPFSKPDLFYLIYGNCISIAMLLVVAGLIFYPELLHDFAELTERAYARTKLNDIDVDSKLAQLHALMANDKVYREEELSLSHVAELLSLSSHQLSELVNTAHDKSFPMYVREFRIREAMELLKHEPNSSVLSIAMATGFKSQSGFYTAFKAETNHSPGDYRKRPDLFQDYNIGQ